MLRAAAVFPDDTIKSERNRLGRSAKLSKTGLSKLAFSFLKTVRSIQWGNRICVTCLVQSCDCTMCVLVPINGLLKARIDTTIAYNVTAAGITVLWATIGRVPRCIFSAAVT